MDDFSRGTKPGPRVFAKSKKVLSSSRLSRSFGFAWAGIVYTWKFEPNFRLELTLGIVAFLMALWLGVSPIPVLLIAALVLSLEILNSAIEALVDLASPDIHPLAKIAKDAAAGAVFLASLIALLIGLWWMGPALLEKLKP